ncbi:hypothetical protein QTO34_000699 [Cnephaeus nilssonii]|uniref:BED-type domain-containing protein n=1 Tax=Cnephaeus nilssonii TaxID=3371016 RepID=A0AA40IBW8_CNENI|nr:hypothetical protein QTO34_000699 [Eptesicus nilssonii]
MSRFANRRVQYSSTLYNVAMEAVTESLLFSRSMNSRKKSLAWKHFFISPQDSMKAVCVYCMKEFSCGKNEKDLSTSCLMQHVKRAHTTALIQEEDSVSVLASHFSPALVLPPQPTPFGDLLTEHLQAHLKPGDSLMEDASVLSSSDDVDPTKVVCLHCSRMISRGKKQTNLGSSCLLRHLQRFHGSMLKTTVAKTMLPSSPGITVPECRIVGITVTDNPSIGKMLNEGEHSSVQCFSHTVNFIVNEAIKSQRMVQNLLSIAWKICERVLRSHVAKEKLAELQEYIFATLLDPRYKASLFSEEEAEQYKQDLIRELEMLNFTSVDTLNRNSNHMSRPPMSEEWQSCTARTGPSSSSHMQPAPVQQAAAGLAAHPHPRSSNRKCTSLPPEEQQPCKQSVSHPRSSSYARSRHLYKEHQPSKQHAPVQEAAASRPASPI